MTTSPALNPILESWNTLDQHAAADSILPCNGSSTWATLMAFNRPFATVEDVFRTSDQAWQSMPEEDWQQAFDSHPRIGQERAKAATEQSTAWSKGEQSKAQADEATAAALAECNRKYEAKFGRIFIVCATGKSAQEILAILKHRLSNDPANELQEAAEQQRLITQLRLRKWLQIPAEAN
jgi:2-oxo-4-hydroxy-4-carboxy-5-ureidoimidazoline decarboxylase